MAGNHSFRIRSRLFGFGAIVGVTCLVAVGTSLPANASSSSRTQTNVTNDGSAGLTHRVRASTDSNCSSLTSVQTCVLNILAPGGATQGVYLRQVGGSVLADSNSTFPYEPASSIKALIALYAIEQVEHGHAHLTDQIPEITESGGTEDCPPLTTSGTESLGNALQQMLQVSDNNRTLELMEYFGVSNLNAFAVSLGLSNTMFQTSSSPPGFNEIGCLSYGYDPLPSTVDGNTMSLADAATLWGTIASLPAPYADEFYQLAAGRDMYNDQGYDFTGLWPAMTTIASQEKPAGMTTSQLNSFTDHMSVSVKGGSYDVTDCTGSCQEATWWVFAGVANIPSCAGKTVKHTNYTWGYFVDDAVGASDSNPDDTAAGTAFFDATGQLLSAPIAHSLAAWKECAPTGAPVLHASGVSVTTTRDVGISTTLARLTDSDKADIAPDLIGTINWGDGKTSYAAISASSVGFTIHGWHAYASTGKHHVSIKVRDERGGASTTATLTITAS